MSTITTHEGDIGFIPDASKPRPIPGRLDEGKVPHLTELMKMPVDCPPITRREILSYCNEREAPPTEPIRLVSFSRDELPQTRPEPETMMDSQGRSCPKWRGSF